MRGEHSSQRLGYLAWGGWEHDPRDGAAEYTARRAAPARSVPGRKTARMRARKVAPAAAIAATLRGRGGRLWPARPGRHGPGRADRRSRVGPTPAGTRCRAAKSWRAPALVLAMVLLLPP